MQAAAAVEQEEQEEEQEQEKEEEEATATISRQNNAYAVHNTFDAALILPSHPSHPSNPSHPSPPTPFGNLPDPTMNILKPRAYDKVNAFYASSTATSRGRRLQPQQLEKEY